MTVSGVAISPAKADKVCYGSAIVLWEFLAFVRRSSDRNMAPAKEI
jgi:hypothetical protein